MKSKMLILTILLCVITLSGCTMQSLNTFTKYATLRFWNSYRTNVLYWNFKDGARVNNKYSPDYFPVHIADNKSYIQFLIDLGGVYAGLPKINTADIEKDTIPLAQFIDWANKPYNEREKTKLELSNSLLYKNLGYRVDNELGTKEPLFILTRQQGFLLPDLVIAMRPVDISNIIKWAVYVKYSKDKGTNL